MAAVAGMTLHGWVEHYAVERPQHPALRTREQSVSYQTLNGLANDLAQQIHAVAAPRSFVIALIEDSIESIIATLAISKAGCARVPLDPRLPPAGIRAILQQVDIALWITDRDHIETAQALCGGKPVLVVDAAALSLRDNLPIEVGLDDPFTLAFTSGSSGIPKGILRTHLHHLQHPKPDSPLEMTAADRVLSFGALSSTGGMSSFRNAFTAGATIDLLDLSRETPQTIFRWIVDEGISYLGTIPSLFRVIFGTPQIEPLTTVRVVRLVSEPVLAVDLEIFKRSFARGSAYLGNSYGATEVGHVSAFMADHSTEIDGATLPVGKPAADITLLITDEQMQSLPIGEIGEIVIRTHRGETGYWNSPEQTREKFRPDPTDPTFRFYLTGDIGKLLPDGNLVYLGRRDAMVKIRGFRVELAAIENRIRQHPNVANAAVKAIAEKEVNRIVAYVVARPGTTLSTVELREFLGIVLPDFMIPAQFYFLDTLPTLPSGKINSAALPIAQLNSEQVTLPTTLTESRLQPLFANVLPVGTIGLTDNFFDMGGDSLRVMRLLTALNVQFHLSLTPALIYQYPTIAQLGGYIDQGSPMLSPLVALNPYGTQIPIIGVPGHGGNALGFRELVGQLGHDYPVYAFHYPTYDPRGPRFETFEALAHYYIDLIAQTLHTERFYLTGMSTGGIIAFEMAKQLTAAGKPPLGVILLDTRLERHRDKPAKSFEEPPLLKLRKRAYRMRRSVVKAFHKSAEEEIRGRVQREVRAMSRLYKLQPYPGKLIFMSCRLNRQQQGLTSTSEAQWEALAGGGFELIDVATDHIGILYQPGVRETAQVFRRILAEQAIV